jgi:hypothetical protein
MKTEFKNWTVSTLPAPSFNHREMYVMWCPLQSSSLFHYGMCCLASLCSILPSSQTLPFPFPFSFQWPKLADGITEHKCRGTCSRFCPHQTSIILWLALIEFIIISMKRKNLDFNIKPEVRILPKCETERRYILTSLTCCRGSRSHNGGYREFYVLVYDAV